MTDISSIIIEMQRLLRETYEQFNDRDFDGAKENAALLKTAADELMKEMESK